VFRDRGSRFLAYAYPIQTREQFKDLLAALKKEHGKAAHHCFAYRMGVDGTQFRVSDDGEPSGSAGRPILGQIDSRNLTDLMVVVVRYFGGTLLGIPGLINAYRSATSAALELATIIEEPVLVKMMLEFDYTRMNDVMRLLRQQDARIITQDLQLFCRMHIGLPLASEENFRRGLDEMAGVRLLPA
jgi:uncharacterized YigZ family protein